MTRLLKARRNEREQGASELIQTLLMLPLAIFMILAMIDVGLFFQARTTVQNSARDAARQVAMWGGLNTRLTPSGYNVENALYKSLYNTKTKKCTYGRCSSAPKVSCKVVNGGGGGTYATSAGQDVYCRVTYSYNPISDNGFLHFDKILKPFTIEEHARTETGFE